jgi:predicted dehydrogenase
MIKTLLIGCGYHAKRIYVPHLKENKNIRISAVFDIVSKKEDIKTYLKEQGTCDVELFFTDDLRISDNLSKKDTELLDEIVEKNKIDAIIISTEPLAHYKYAKWALERGLHILMDKPITTEYDVSISHKKAKKIYSDYLKLKKLYLKKIKEKNISFILQAQRRYHEGFQKTRELIKEIANKTNCPITSVQVFHSDGQWRFPREIIEQDYHPYNQGYGKMSHSGYHGLDVAIWFTKSSILDSDKKYNNFEVYSQVVRPVDFIKQLNKNDYQNIFPSISKDNLMSQKEFENESKKDKSKSVTGEIDAHSLIALKHDKYTITNIGVHAVHNGFGQRNWESVIGRDLYKGNGRVRHESYIIEQGPFQSIIVNSYQSHEIFKSDIDKYEVGGEYHYDIHVFRNSALFPEYKTYELLTMKELRGVEDLNYSRGHQENARRNCVEDFVLSINNNSSPKKEISNFLSHDLSTQILSSIYRSVSKKGKVIRDKIKNE